MKNIIKFFIFIGVILIAINTNKYIIKMSRLLITDFNMTFFNSTNKSLRFTQLPKDVQDAFIKVYDYCEPPTVEGADTFKYMAPFVEAHNINGDTVIITPSFLSKLYLDNHFYIKSNDRIFLSNLSIIERVYIIKDNLIYYPANGPGVNTYGQPRSYDVRVDTLRFGVQRMIVDW